ncbi:hypothetical protein Sjap_008449 [Stephania japonica]|uniref:Uncharacterized protein n=1 Tax=Stephania japonica TaxID=461633 RepID=A0AAP0JQC3_9MAGN
MISIPLYIYIPLALQLTLLYFLPVPLLRGIFFIDAFFFSIFLLDFSLPNLCPPNSL